MTIIRRFRSAARAFDVARKFDRSAPMSLLLAIRMLTTGSTGRYRIKAF